MEIYLSYAEEDEKAGKRLKLLLKPLENRFGFTSWSKQDVKPGERWQQKMAEHLGEAWLFIPVLSADYLASDRCHAEAMASLQLEKKGKLRVVSVFLRPCFIDVSPFQGNPVLPNKEKPITLWGNQDQIWLQVQQGILDILQSTQIDE